MTTFAREWTLESAMKVLAHPTVDSALWAEAVEWLLLYGPPEIREMIEQSSTQATAASFPDLQPRGCTPDGNLCYAIDELAAALGITEEEARKRLAEQERRHGVRQGFADGEITSVQ
ncbi:MAG: hypothetical protein ACOX5Z_12695 [Desulfobulbus sp.]|jgi:hypothetical protein